MEKLQTAINTLLSVKSEVIESPILNHSLYCQQARHLLKCEC